MALLPPARLAEIHSEVTAATQPATELERWFANEITQATWELERVRANKSNVAAEPRLNDAYNCATRNWTRARKELARIQTSRVNHGIRLSPSRQKEAAGAPLADPARARAPKPASRPMHEHIMDLIETGAISGDIYKVLNEQGRR